MTGVQLSGQGSARKPREQRVAEQEKIPINREQAESKEIVFPITDSSVGGLLEENSDLHICVCGLLDQPEKLLRAVDGVGDGVLSRDDNRRERIGGPDRG